LPPLAELSALPVRSRNPSQRSFPHPFRPSSLDECGDAFLRVGCFHQLVEINLLRARQTFAELSCETRCTHSVTRVSGSSATPFTNPSSNASWPFRVRPVRTSSAASFCPTMADKATAATGG